MCPELTFSLGPVDSGATGIPGLQGGSRGWTQSQSAFFRILGRGRGLRRR